MPYDWQLIKGYLIGPNANLSSANLENADLYGASLNNVQSDGTNGVENSTGSPYYYENTKVSNGFDPVTKGWILALYCDFTPDAACDLTDINKMFQAGNLLTGVPVDEFIDDLLFTVHEDVIDRLDLVDNDIIDAADITEWLSLASTEIGYDTPFSRGDINLDHDVDTRDLTAMIIGFTSAGGTGKTWNTGDTDGDGDVDSGDLTTAIINFTGASNAASTVPERLGCCWCWPLAAWLLHGVEAIAARSK